ncbi:MAG: GNAT family N-acetyltransferase [Nitrospirae bacterium]|nr:MAG: GNAT family N-acetyltransferase [Nitrospirota bacterium]
MEFRDFDPSDYWRLAEIYDTIFPERSRSIDEWRFYDDSLDKSKYYFKRFTCLSVASGEVLGFGEMWNPPWMFHPNKFWLDGWVDPKHQGQGVGGSRHSSESSEKTKSATPSCTS